MKPSSCISSRAQTLKFPTELEKFPGVDGETPVVTLAIVRWPKSGCIQSHVSITAKGHDSPWSLLVNKKILVMFDLVAGSFHLTSFTVGTSAIETNCVNITVDITLGKLLEPLDIADGCRPGHR